MVPEDYSKNKAFIEKTAEDIQELSIIKNNGYIINEQGSFFEEEIG